MTICFLLQHKSRYIALLGGQILSITVVKAKRSEPSEGESKCVSREREREREYVPTLHTMFSTLAM